MMNGNSPIKKPEAPLSATPSPESSGLFESVSGAGMTVSRIPVEAIRGRVMTNLANTPDTYGEVPTVSEIAETAFERALSKNTVEEAIAEIRASFPEAGNEREAFAAFLSEYRSVFAIAGRRSAPKSWEQLRCHPTFEMAVVDYLKKMVPAIFKNKYSRSLYEDIEYGLFLLGSAQNFDVLEDIRHGGMRGLS